MTLLLEDSRRLTGANLFWDHPAAVIDVGIEDGASEVIGHWQSAVDSLLESVGEPIRETTYRLFEGGASLVIQSPIDALYAMCELNEVAWAQAVHACGAGPAPDVAAEVTRLREAFAAERQPAFIALQGAAHRRGVPFLWDDAAVSLGFGRHSQVWPRGALPDVREVEWAAMKSVPLALVTGTNGKSTTVRMVAAMMRAAGLSGGLTSTDFIRVGEKLIERGDYSGTEGARLLLRHPEVDMAVLEVARGSLLRRGLAVDQADAALITNIAADHIGDYGIRSVADLTEAKFIVRRALPRGAPLILNADDEGLVRHAEALQRKGPLRVWWFSLDATHPLIRAGIAGGAGVCWLEDGEIRSNAVRRESAGAVRVLARLEEAPSTRGGLIRHNIRNAMGSVLLAIALGLPDEAIRRGLAGFQGDDKDNPGRGNWFEGHGVRIVVDFAHNEHGLHAVAETVAALPAGRIVLMMGQAGDRSDEAIRGLARVGFSLKPARLLLCGTPGYERGRAPDEVARIMRDAVLSLGMADADIELFPEPRIAARSALAQARPGDLLVLLALTQREEVLRMVHAFIDDGASDG